MCIHSVGVFSGQVGGVCACFLDRGTQSAFTESASSHTHTPLHINPPTTDTHVTTVTKYGHRQATDAEAENTTLTAPWRLRPALAKTFSCIKLCFFFFSFQEVNQCTELSSRRENLYAQMRLDFAMFVSH